MTIRIYLAGASSEIDRCERWRDALRERGYDITHDWMADVRANAHRPDREIPADERCGYALRDVGGVLVADAMWLLAPSNGSIGCWVELGFALGARIVPIVSGPWRTIFQDLPVVHRFERDEDAFAALAWPKGAGRQ
jgi:hypothetical protein